MNISRLALITFFPGFASGATISFTAVKDYNAGSGVDTNSSGAALGSTNANDVAGFTTAVATAYDNDMGGVVDFEGNRTLTSADNTGLEITYGGSKTITLTASTNGTNNRIYTNAFGSLGFVSGTDGLLPTSGNTKVWRMTFTSITGASPGEIVTSAGFSLLSRDSTGQDVSVEWFIDGATATAAFTDTETITTGRNVDNTFFSYTAPDGSSISSFRINFLSTQTDARLGIDDLGFITSPVPEPSTALLLLGSILPLIRRRRA